MEKYAREIGKGASAEKISEINRELTKLENSLHGFHKLGVLLKRQMDQAAESFSKWFSAGTAVNSLIAQTQKAVAEIREMDTLLTRIGTKNNALSTSALKDIADRSFDVAGRYGRKASDYLQAFQAASDAGYQNADEIAELSVAAQSAGDLTFQLAEGMAALGQEAAASGMDIRETAAALAAILSLTGQDGAEAAQTLKDFLSGGLLPEAENGAAAEITARYQAMLRQYSDGTGSLARETEAMADT